MLLTRVDLIIDKEDKPVIIGGSFGVRWFYSEGLRKNINRVLTD